jgi:hypothetical protein
MFAFHPEVLVRFASGGKGGGGGATIGESDIRARR